MKHRFKGRNPMATAWLAVGGLLAVGMTLLMIREIPAMRREFRIMRM